MKKLLHVLLPPLVLSKYSVRSKCYYTCFLSEETGSEMLSDLPKVSELLRIEVNSSTDMSQSKDPNHDNH